MDCKPTFRKNKYNAFTLAELMIAGGIGVLLLTTMTVVYVYYLRSFAGLENYMNLNNENRYALDVMSREIRQADMLLSYSVNDMTFQLTDPVSKTAYNVTYSYAPADQKLIRSSRGSTKVLLNTCTYWTNNIFDRNFNVVSSPTNCKVVQLTWVCARGVLGHTNNTEDVQSAKVVIRKQKS